MLDRGDFAPKRHSGGGRLIALILTALFAAWALPAQADLYSVEGISVTGRGKTADEAREAAIAKGRANALRQLLERLTKAGDHNRLPSPGGKALAGMVKGVKVETERAGATYYRGRLTYIFDPAGVQRLLRDANIAFVETTTRPILVLAIWQEGDRLVLWDDPNPWREAWRRLEQAGTMVRFLRPGGGLRDIQAVSAKQAVDNDREALGAIATNYKAFAVLIAHATEARGRVTILVRRFNPATGQVRFVGNYTSANNEAALTKAAHKVVGDVEEGWKSANIIPPGSLSTITVRAPLDGLTYWIRLRDGLNQVTIIRNRRIISLTPAMAVIQISYAGQISHLTEALRQNDLDLRKSDPDDPDAWELRLAAAKQPAGATAKDRPVHGGPPRDDDDRGRAPKRDNSRDSTPGAPGAPVDRRPGTPPGPDRR